MGQRHQLFVIAKINGRYRSLAAVHHQWLYGRTALARCADLLAIFSNPKNAIALQDELNFAAIHEHFWEEADELADDQTPHFPFVMTCLILGASYGEEGYLHKVHPEPFDMQYNHGDNNNGITIIDITNLKDVRYCFVDFYGMESTRQVQLMTPLNGKIYLEAYYDLDNPEEGEYLQEYVTALDAWKIITVEALEDTWSGEGWEIPNHGASEDDTDLDLAEGVKSLSLRDRSFKKLIETIVSGDEVDPDIVTQAEETLSDFWPKVGAELYENAGTINFNKNVLDLLIKCLEDNDTVDLTPFKNLQCHQVFEIADRLASNGQHVRELNLSGLLSQENLLAFLSKSFDIGTLFLARDDLNAEQIAHPNAKYEVYSASLAGRAFEMEALSRKSRQAMKASQSHLKVLDFSGSFNSPVHAAYITIPWGYLLDRESYDAEGFLKYEATTQIPNIRPSYEMGWGSEHTGIGCAKYPLTDIALPINRLAGALKTHCQWLSDPEALSSSINRMHDAFACALALGAAPHDLNGGVGPLSPTLFDSSMLTLNPKATPSKGQWVMILVQSTTESFSRRNRDRDISRIQNVMREAGNRVKLDPTKVYYAMVSPSDKENEDNRYRVVDIPEYCNIIGGPEAAEVAEWWRTQVAHLDYINFYDFGEDVQTMLKSIYGDTVEDPTEKK